MFTREEFCLKLAIEQSTLEWWLEEGWILPREEGPGYLLSDVDLARARLIRDLRDSMGVNEEGISVILNLVDQLHGLRSLLQALLQRSGSSNAPTGG